MLEDAAAEVRRLLDDGGSHATRIESLSPPGRGRKTGRRAFRIVRANGTLVKARLFASADDAERLAVLRGGLDVPFLPVMERRGALLLEPWVAGEELSPARAEARARELGALMGRLHVAAPGEIQEHVSTRERRERAGADLDDLADARVLPASLLEALRRRLAEEDPGTAPAVPVHRDFCPENVVEDPGGGLHLIDNEWLGLDAAGVDLGRTHSRWPVSEAGWREFLAGYASTAPALPDALGFWLVMMAARSARVRLDGPAEALALPLARLREAAAGEASR
ncbi:MAG: phosphotransferase [Myxococcota bacterium]